MITVKTTEPAHLNSDDVVVIAANHDHFYQQCCDCGLVHRVEVLGREPALRLMFVRIGPNFPADLVIENHIERPE